MKKILTLMTVAGVAACLSACAGHDDTASRTTSTTVESTSVQPVTPTSTTTTQTTAAPY